MISRQLKKAMLAAAVIGVIGGSVATDARAENLSFKDEAAFGEAVKKYILENPQVLFEAIERHRAQEEQERLAAAAEGIKEHTAYLTRAEAPSIGNPNADITIVEFFDYNCGYCKRALPDIQKTVEGDKNVRVVFKDMAILGPSSRTAALWSLASHKQGKYFDFHVALMNHRGPKDDDQLMKLAASVGMDAHKLKEDANSKEIAAQLDKDMAIARAIGAQGTPAFIIGSEFIPGYVDAKTMQSIVTQEREKLKKDG